MDERKQSSTEAPITLRRRKDLEVYPQRIGVRQFWVIKDPVTLEFFQLRLEEYAIFLWLDGTKSLVRIKSLFEQHFAPKRLSLARVRSFVRSLHRSGLVMSDVIGQGEQMIRKHQRSNRSRKIDWLANPLAIRVPGFDPARLLDWLYPRLRWLFTPSFAAACVLLVVTAIGLTIGRWSEFATRLPEWNTLLSPTNLIALGAILAFTKVLHEVGHALTCKHHGGHCHEMGLMLLVMMPCLYCDVSDSWRLSARKRIIITVAGIAIEVVLASAFAIVWWLTQPGFLNTLALNVMIVCSAGTIFINGNPLLRYDGYYILSDLVGAPNLWHEANRRINRTASILFLGIDPGQSAVVDGRWWLYTTFGVLSAIYRTVVIASIVYLVYQTCKPIGVLFLVPCLITLLLFRALINPFKAVWSAIVNPVRRARFRPIRLIGTSTLVLALLYSVASIPLPYRLSAITIIRPDDAKNVYVSVPGRLEVLKPAGSRVGKGDILAKLANPSLELELANLRGQLRRQHLRIKSLESLRRDDAVFANELPAAKEVANDLQDRLHKLEDDARALEIESPNDGIVIAPPQRVRKTSENDLPYWQGPPLVEENVGAYLEARTLLCLVGKPNAHEAVVFVHQSEVEFIREGQRAALRLDVAGTETLHGKVVEVSRLNLEEVPPQLAVDQQIPNHASLGRSAKPIDTWFQAHVRFDEAHESLVIGATGRARISVDPQPIGSRLMRWFFGSFRRV